ncbi:hypothetical protein [Mucilaginibacter oryzae]|uniref:hypothetical protein n=1 Tax=Mucilaginibacter oryzae TaxID=468058 RepID=UPI0003B6C1BC|nr:hypothetical protein [Mucilaginibacter oryzae]
MKNPAGINGCISPVLSRIKIAADKNIKTLAKKAMEKQTGFFMIDLYFFILVN